MKGKSGPDAKKEDSSDKPSEVQDALTHGGDDQKRLCGEVPSPATGAADAAGANSDDRVTGSNKGSGAAGTVAEQPAGPAGGDESDTDDDREGLREPSDWGTDVESKGGGDEGQPTGKEGEGEAAEGKPEAGEEAGKEQPPAPGPLPPGAREEGHLYFMYRPKVCGGRGGVSGCPWRLG